MGNDGKHNEGVEKKSEFLRRKCFGLSGDLAVAQAIERATTGQQFVGLIPVQDACSLLIGSVSGKCDRLRQKS